MKACTTSTRNAASPVPTGCLPAFSERARRLPEIRGISTYKLNGFLAAPASIILTRFTPYVLRLPYCSTV